jgi:hypothetical protein
MHKDFQDLLYIAEKRYLQKTQLKTLTGHLDTLKVRLATYKKIRDQEIPIFQEVVDKLLLTASDIPPETIEQVLKHWLAVMRYATMAMLLNNPEFLQRRILEWLTPQIKAHQIEAIETKFYQALVTKIKETLTQEQFALMQPFLSQAQTTLLGAESNQRVLAK